MKTSYDKTFKLTQDAWGFKKEALFKRYNQAFQGKTGQYHSYWVPAESKEAYHIYKITDESFQTAVDKGLFKESVV